MKRCLVVDDSKFWRMILHDILKKKSDLDVHFAENAVEAINLAFQVKPDVVITDYNMPGLSGLLLCMYLRSIEGFENVGIAILTGSDDVISAFWASKSGADRFISKMLQRQQLEEEILKFVSEEKFVCRLKESFLKRDVYWILESKMKNEILNREILKLIDFVRDEGYVLRKLRDLFLNFSPFAAMHSLVLSPVEGRIFSFGKEVNFDELKEKLVCHLEKPIQPSQWSFYPLKPIKIEPLSDLFVYTVKYSQNEVGALAFEEPEEIFNLTSALNDAKESLGLLFNALNVVKELTVQSSTDGLTNLLNKKALLANLEEIHARSKKDGNTYAVAIFDIDDFKKINDTYGHIVGDEVLKSMANLLKEKLREKALVGRYGGEEFVAIFPQVDENNLVKIINELLDKVRSFKFPFVEKCTVSCGVALGKNKQSALETLQEADQFLYIAKRSGKNQARFSFL
ncbi:GGDEF domain-containing response regulator [Pseudothermotoga thermarum]|uniref:GGDEF domain-containing response regulator n=1 Tax=Pseudothermotoga thermarum TaxID=119394 RepID=UPI00059B9269|nr:diguanylate cyclase [Pseudothermotoga thermarum]